MKLCAGRDVLCTHTAASSLRPCIARTQPPPTAKRHSEVSSARWYPARRMQQVLVLNAGYEPLNVCSLRRAHVLVWKGKAEIVESLDRPLRSAGSSFVWPHVIRLFKYVRVPQAVKRRISRRALFARDGWRCVYCGTTGGRLTLDHVVPRSRGGDSV